MGGARACGAGLDPEPHFKPTRHHAACVSDAGDLANVAVKHGSRASIATAAAATFLRVTTRGFIYLLFVFFFFFNQR